MKVTTVGISLFLALVLVSCDSMPVNYSFSQSWLIPEAGGAGEAARRTIKLAGVSVDRSSGWDSLEKEVAALAPLYFWQSGYRLAEQDGAADYAAQISLREREFAVGWHTKRSLAVEVRIWASPGEEMPVDGLFGTLPLAAGRVVAIGDGSFSSSKTTGKMLSRAIGKAAGSLPPAGKGN